MFLGWVFNALTVGFVVKFLPQHLHGGYRHILILINFLLVCMLIAFPLQGYGIYSIFISTIHTLAVIVFCLRFFKDTKDSRYVFPVWFARTSLFFFLISAIGPIAVGVLAANGLGQTKWYHLMVYYYLHFQYNGVFTFGILALFFQLLEEKGIRIDQQKAKKFGMLFFLSCFPAYVLSTLWTNPGLLVNGIGLLAALGQLLALTYFFQSLQNSRKAIADTFLLPARVLLLTSLLAFTVKLILQLLSAHPYIAMLAYDVRFYVIAYLHLVLIGMVSLFLLAWYREAKLISSLKWFYVIMLLLGFVSSEFIMIGVGQWPASFNVPKGLVFASGMLILGIGGVVFDSYFRKET